MDIDQLIGEGMRNEEICRKLGVEESVVEYLRTRRDEHAKSN